MIEKLRAYQTAFLNWREKYISDRNFILLLSFVVGIISGVAAVLLKNLVHFIGDFITSSNTLDRLNWWMLILPMVGIILTVIYVKVFLKDDISHGISKVLYAISRGGGKLKRSKSYSSMIASALTVSFGGSVGLEAPVVLTGSSIGSNIGQIMRVDYRSLILLIACGATGAVAAIFKAPLAGVVFALEVLMLDLTMASIIPLLISSCTAAVLSWLLLGRSVMFSFDINAIFYVENVTYYIILGVFTGLVSLYFTRTSQKIEEIFSKIKNYWKKALIGGLLLSLLIFIFPPLFGEGFTFLNDILEGKGNDMVNNSFFFRFKDNYWMFLGFLVLILVFKVIAMAITNGSGGVGGVFAPSLFMGGVAGFFLVRILNGVFDLNLPENNFALAGMAGVMAGVMHAPLTAIFLIAEITGGYQLFLPLIITATISYITNFSFEPYSVYTKYLAERGELITHHKDKAALCMLNMQELIETSFLPLNESGTLRNVVEAIEKSTRNVFPVLDNSANFIGVVFLNDIKEIIFKPELYDEIKIIDILIPAPVSIQLDEEMESVAKKFKATDQYNIVVLNGNKYVGFLSRANVFSAYRKMVFQFSDE